MKMIFLLSLGICSIISSDSRLIERITDRTLTTETKTGSSPPLRLARQIYGDYLAGLKDDIEDNHDLFKRFNRNVRHFNTGRSNPAPPRRQRRESTERVDKLVKNVTVPVTTPSGSGRTKSETVLVKKPIPKYSDMDYYDDFQMKIIKSPVKLLDSGEHEDEDFNVDDYEFDVNHDEFIGRGKPLEPRIKNKGIENKPKSETKHFVAPEIKIKSKLNIPHQMPSSKKERSAERQKKTNEKEDYDDEPSTTTKAPKKGRELSDEFNEENEESKEFYSKISNVRLIRSPWKVNSLTETVNDKASLAMSKTLSILPMFPQVPNEGNDFEYRVGPAHHSGWSNKGLSA